MSSDASAQTAKAGGELRPRPLSPHLTVYRPQITSMTSIFHRITGVALAVGSVILVLWLWGAAYAPELFSMIVDCFRSTVGQLLLAAWSFAFFYHMCNGIRHLGWDAGYGYAIEDATRNGVLVILAALFLTGATWFAVLG